MKKTWLLILLSTLTIITLAACGNKDNPNDIDALPEPNLDGIPDVVIEINGETITKDEFSNMYTQQFQQEVFQAQMMGLDISALDEDALKLRTADIIVAQNLLMQEANNRFEEVSEDDINETIDLLLQQTEFETKEDLLVAVGEQGIDEKEFLSQVEVQVKVDQLLDEISKDIELTEEETMEAYESLKAQQEEIDGGEEFPAFDEIKSDLEQQLKFQKEGEEIETFVEKLRKDADVTIHL